MKHCKSRHKPGLASEALLSRLTPGEQCFSSWLVSTAERYGPVNARNLRSNINLTAHAGRATLQQLSGIGS